MFTSETKVRVRYVETDPMGFVYHSNFFPYFEVARTESIRQLGFTYADMEKWCGNAGSGCTCQVSSPGFI